jgi:membrane-bound ClpP family serine protease
MENAAEQEIGPTLGDTSGASWGTEQTMNERVTELAAALWSSAGRKNGRDLDFWLMAEKMVREDLEWRARHASRKKGIP